MRLVILESPHAGEVEANIAYARQSLRDCLLRGESPIASHLLYTQPGVLDDDIPEERQLGIDAGLAWRKIAMASVVYIDRGISKGMEYGIRAVLEAGIPVEYRHLEQAAYRNRGRLPACPQERNTPMESLNGITVKNITGKSIDGQEATGWTLIHDNTGLRMLAPCRHDSDWSFTSKVRAESFRREVLRLGNWPRWNTENEVSGEVLVALEKLSTAWYLGKETTTAHVSF